MAKPIFTIASALFLAGSLISTNLYAQGEDHTPAGTATLQQQDFSNEDIEQFAKASKQVSEISNTYSNKIQAAPSPEEAHTLGEEAHKKMVQAVKASGLDVATYNNIAQAATQDPSLRRKIIEAQSH